MGRFGHSEPTFCWNMLEQSDFLQTPPWLRLQSTAVMNWRGLDWAGENDLYLRGISVQQNTVRRKPTKHHGAPRVRTHGPRGGLGVEGTLTLTEGMSVTLSTGRIGVSIRQTTMADPNDNNDSIDQGDKWPLTPLVSTADLPTRLLPTVEIPEERLYPLKDHGRRRVRNGARGSERNHILGVLGEGATAQYRGFATDVDTNLYADGDGGVDCRWNGHTVDVKTVGRGRRDPALTVDAYSELNADYYVLARRVGESTFRLEGYCPRQFVANARTAKSDGRQYHVVPREDLFTLPLMLQ